jgi:hypothetical protein
LAAGLNHDRLPLQRRAAGAIDDAHIGERNDRLGDGDELTHGRRERRHRL